MRVLAICYYVFGGFMCLIAMIPLIHVTIGIMMLSGKMKDHGNSPPAFIGIMFVVMGAIAIMLLLAFALTLIYINNVNIIFSAW